MSVSLRIVGNFYHQDDIPHHEGMTVANVLEYASANPVQSDTLKASRFAYEVGRLTIGPDAGKPSIRAFYAEYSEPFKSVTSGLPYDAGGYYLPENLYSQPAYTVWQFYVFTARLQEGGATYLPNETRIDSFVDAKVPDGGFVIWRLVSVLSGPNSLPMRKQGEIMRLEGKRG